MGQDGLVKQAKRIIKVQPVMTADDNGDNDVAFDWTAVSGVSHAKGSATMLQSVAILDADDSAAALELWFCIGSDADGTAPTAAQGMIGGAGAGSAVIDITGAEAQAVQICGNIQMTLSEGDLLTAYGITKTNIGLILQPALNSNTIYMAGVWRGDPAATGATNTLDVYLGFES
tara:strand:+ start:1391 stop:1912 length:522 start_codon:yes stop_codon:yes gene_type:complete